jgi:hypothetical protein
MNAKWLSKALDHIEYKREASVLLLRALFLFILFFVILFHTSVA